jgi:histidine ammonia-lyase
MGPIAARKTCEILRNTQLIVAIELLCAAQGIEFRGPKKLGKGTGLAYLLIREKVAPLKDDRVLLDDIESVAELVRDERFSTLQ